MPKARKFEARADGAGGFPGGPGLRAAPQSFLRSLEADPWLFPADLWVDRAHVAMLAKQRILPKAEAARILQGLDSIERDGVAGIRLEEREDLHTAIEAELTERIGPAGGRMHTARSRNDEVATCIRVALRDDLLAVHRALLDLRAVLVARATEEAGTLMPGFTHLQPAQPTTLGHHLLAHAAGLGRDTARLRDLWPRLNVSPLGAAALASTRWPVDSDTTARLLGFDGVFENSMDATGDRDFLLEALAALALLMVRLSRMAEELVNWSSPAFGFVVLAPGWATGSSIMPQKRNPDAAELIRGRAGLALGALTAAAAMAKNLPLAYNRDLQEMTPLLLRALRGTRGCLEAMEEMVRTMDIRRGLMERMAGADFSTATDVADTLAHLTGIPFRQAHRIVGSLGHAPSYPRLEAAFKKATGRPLKSAGFGPKEFERCLDPRGAVEARGRGGPSPAELGRAVAAARETLRDDRQWVSERERRIEAARAETRAAVRALLK
ncbi:MAG: argininosuccinate lyase [Halobacteria archaeon]